MKIKTKLMMAVASIMLIFGASVAPISVGAETVDSEPIVSVETSTEIGDVTDDTTTDDNLVVGTEKGEITVDFSELSYEDFLAVIDVLAKETGNEDLWRATLDSVKKAVDEKQLTLATAMIIVVAVLLSVKIISDWVVKHKEKKHIAQGESTAKNIKLQTTALNGMMDEEEKISENVEALRVKSEKLAEAGLEQNAALRCFVRGVQLNDTARDEALRHLNNSDELYEIAKK